MRISSQSAHTPVTIDHHTVEVAVKSLMTSIEEGIPMKICLSQWKKDKGWQHEGNIRDFAPQVVLSFFSADLDDYGSRVRDLETRYPNANVISVSTGGEIFGADADDHSVAVSALNFETTEVEVHQAEIGGIEDSKDVGILLAKKIAKPGLSGVMLFCDGLHVNGTALLEGLYSVIDRVVPITGGLAGDGSRFEATRVGLGAQVQSKQLVIVGLYGSDLRMTSGCAGGWVTFGQERKVTHSEGNVLYTLDNQPALELYKKYLTADQASELPGSGLLFPLSIEMPNADNQEIVRTIVGIDEDKQALIFAGDIPQGAKAKLMLGSFENLIDGAATAAESAVSKESLCQGETFFLQVSCIGRKLLMGERVGDETEATLDSFPKGAKTIGFYSYGEIAPHPTNKIPALHNQTMTISSIGEAA